MEARGSVVSKARLIRRVSTACVIDELLKEFVSLVSEVTTSLVRERHEVLAPVSTWKRRYFVTRKEEGGRVTTTRS